MSNDYFSYNEETREITFDLDSPRFKTERDVLQANGIDILSLKTFDEYLPYYLEFRHMVMHVIESKWINKIPKNNKEKLTKALVLCDMDTAREAAEFVKRKKSLSLRTVSSPNKKSCSQDVYDFICCDFDF